MKINRHYRAMGEQDINVIVVNWNGREHLSTCLYSLLNQSHPNVEIILVDNGSTDGSVELVAAEFPSVKIIKLDENRGFCGGNNAGIQASRGEFVALINNDTEADPNWLEECAQALQAHPEAGFIASRICLFERRDYLDTAGDLYFRTGYPAKRGWLMPYDESFEHPEWVFGACGGAAVYRRKMLEQTGLFDEEYFNFQEDIDLSFRAQLLGYRCLYVPTAIVYHKVGATAGMDSPLRQFWSHRNHWYTLIKDLPTRLWLRYLSQIIAADVLVGGSALLCGRVGVFLRARWEVLRNLPALVQKRRAIQSNRKVSDADLDEMIHKHWFAFRSAEKARQRAYYARG